MILTHADRMRKRVAQKYLYRSGWLAGVAGRSWRWLAGVRFPAGWLARGLFTGWRPAGWRAGGPLAGWRWHAWRALAWRPGPYRVHRWNENQSHRDRPGTRFDAGWVGSHLRYSLPVPSAILGTPTGLCYYAQMLHTGAGPLPRHTYCYVEPHTFGNADWLRVAWFGLVSHPGRTWGCHVMLECGAVYRNVPLHRLASMPTQTRWDPADAQTWDCYGIHFSTTEYPFLEGTRIRTRLRSKQEHLGTYMFTVIPMLDGFSMEPEQSKEFYFIKLDNGRFTAQPTNHLLVQDKSFITGSEWPKLKRQTDVWSVDHGNEVKGKRSGQLHEARDA